MNKVFHAIGLVSTLMINSVPSQDEQITIDPVPAVRTLEDKMFDFAVGKFLTEQPNNYRRALFQEEREIAKTEYTIFSQETSTNSPKPAFDVILFDGKTQQLHHLEKSTGGELTINDTYTCSSGRYGFSNRSGSKKPPTGLLYIEKKHGEGAKVGKVFDYKYAHYSRRTIVPGKNTHKRAYMTTRRIDFETWRGLAIHGTNHEAYLGKQRSHGCIRMSNTDVVKFFDSVDVGTPLYISVDLEKELLSNDKISLD
jgi:lipoprotein-anchoring transpeptidase ErfK/SrfK